MARGHPDYNVADIAFFSITDPNADVLATMSGFSRLDNRGRIIWFDDFRQGLTRWSIQSGATGIDPYHVVGEEVSIGFYGSVLVDCEGNGGTSQMDTTLVLPVSKKLGIEVSLRLMPDFGDFEIILAHNYGGTAAKEARLYITSGTGAIEIYDNLTRRTIFTPSAISQLLNSWISLKLVADYENNKWLRCMIGNQQFDLSSYALRNGSSSLQGYTDVIIRNTGTSATLKEEWYIGYVIISGDEP